MVSEAPKLSVKIEGAIATIFVIPIISGMTGEAEKFNGTDGRPEFEAVVHLAPGDVLFLRK